MHMVQLMSLTSPKPHHLLPNLNPDWFHLSGTGLSRLSYTGVVVAVTIGWEHRCKNVFKFFLFWSRFLRFLFSERSFLKKNVCKVQSGKQINKKHFQNKNIRDHE